MISLSGGGACLPAESARFVDVLVNVHGVVASADLARVPRARGVAAGRLAVDVVGVVRGVRAAAPALLGVLDTEVGGSRAVRLAELRGEKESNTRRRPFQQYNNNQSKV